MSTLGTLQNSIGDITAQLYSHIVESEDLAGVTIVQGSVVKPLPKMPAVWLVPGQATAIAQSFGAFTWQLPISLVSLVKDVDPIEGANLAQQLAATTLTVALATPWSDDANVSDTQPESYNPTATSGVDNRTLYSTDATIMVTFDCTI